MKTLENWDVAEWEAMKVRLWGLSLDQLQTLATYLGIQFTGGNTTVRYKEDLIHVMDEADKETLEKAIEKMLTRTP